MISIWSLSLISIAYLGLMFIVAHFAERGWWQSPRMKLLIYTLALGSCGTSWAYYGTVAQVAQSGWFIPPIYVGTILFFMVAMPLYQQILVNCKKHNITSIADYIASRFGRSGGLGALITLVIFVGLIPYIALQLRAVATSFDILTAQSGEQHLTAIKMTVLIALFCIAFGTKKVFTSQQNPGLLTVVALSSVVKLIALTLLGGLIYFKTGENQSLSFWPNQLELNQLAAAHEPSSGALILTQIILGALTVFCLPRLFHLFMIENSKVNHLTTARWSFPLYLLASNVFILPIAWFGHQLFESTPTSTDSYVLMIPMILDQQLITLTSYLGGFSAAIAMIIVATIVLSNMISNQLVTPFLLKNKLISHDNDKQYQPLLLLIRRSGIVGVLFLAWWFHQSSAQDEQLASIGLFSFVLLVQTFPALFFAVMWRRANRIGVISGIIAGTIMWCYTLALPIVFPELELSRSSLFSLSELDPLSFGVLLSLGSNFICLILGSLLSAPTVKDVMSSDDFNQQAKIKFKDTIALPLANDLFELLVRFVSKEQAATVFAGATMNKAVTQLNYNRTEHLLSGVMGSASTRMLLNAVVQQQKLLPEVVDIVSEAKAVLSFNRELLQSAVETIDTGISVYDYDMKLVAWNQSYQRLLQYPDDYLEIGLSVEQLLTFNAERGIFETNNLSAAIKKRLEYMRCGTRHLHQRQTKSGLVLELRGHPISGGGYVTSITDITEHIRASENLKQLNETLEQRVLERTNELELARQLAERANLNKSRFLAAASHDLMQPFNAASLFSQMLARETANTSYAPLVNNLLSSLASAESQLTDLLDISKLDAGRQIVLMKDIAVDEILAPLAQEFTLLAQDQGVAFSYCYSGLWIRTDPLLLRRIIQNFLSNAVRYCSQTRVLLGVRRQGDDLLISVIDTGAGIEPDKLTVIFDEFIRLQSDTVSKGLGLGLSIAERLSKIINQPLSVQSTVDRGSCFSVKVPRVAKPVESISSVKASAKDFAQMTLGQVTNKSFIEDPLLAIILSWGCQLQQSVDCKLDFVICDYHQSGDANGIELLQHWLKQSDYRGPCIVYGCEKDLLVRESVIAAGFSYCAKQIKPLALKRLLRKLID